MEENNFKLPIQNIPFCFLLKLRTRFWVVIFIFETLPERTSVDVN